MANIRTVQYAGGKAGGRPVGKWIIATLPPVEPGQLYIEPFGGMLGVMLNRPRAGAEIANDLNPRIVNWWNAARDDPAALAEAIVRTPYARTEFERCLAGLDDPAVGAVERARRLTVILGQSMQHSDHAAPCDWSLSQTQVGRIDWRPRLRAVAARLQGVRLTNRPALDLLADHAENPAAVIYLDPPYPSTKDFYRHAALPAAAYADVLAGARARVAISGFEGDGWGEFGWHRHYLRRALGVGRTPTAKAAKTDVKVVTEVLWCNYRPGGRSRPQLFS